MIFNPESGVFGWLSKHGISIPDPLINTDTSLYGIALVNLWAWWGFLTVIFFAALRQNLDSVDPYRKNHWSILVGAYLPLST